MAREQVVRSQRRREPGAYGLGELHQRISTIREHDARTGKDERSLRGLQPLGRFIDRSAFCRKSRPETRKVVGAESNLAAKDRAVDAQHLRSSIKVHGTKRSDKGVLKLTWGLDVMEPSANCRGEPLLVDVLGR
jgi:hypothetical protein